MTNYEAMKERKRMESMAYMSVHDLCRECLVELKQTYIAGLVNEGVYSEVMGVEYDEPSIGEYVEADSLIPDEVVFEHFEGVNFVPDDFFCLMEMGAE